MGGDQKQNSTAPAHGRLIACSLALYALFSPFLRRVYAAPAFRADKRYSKNPCRSVISPKKAVLPQSFTTEITEYAKI
jgi:hypothetical protein